MRDYTPTPRDDDDLKKRDYERLEDDYENIRSEHLQYEAVQYKNVQYKPVPDDDRGGRKDAPGGGRNGGAPRAGISLMVVARNQAEFLADCLHSTLCQTVPAREVIYLDDGSDDDSPALARRFESSGVTVLSRPHRGVAAARNDAASTSRGDLLLFVDGDNILAPDFLELQLDALQGGAGFAYPAKQNFGRFRQHWQPPEYDRNALWVSNYIDTSTLVRRELFDAAGRWRETRAGTLWDWDLFLRTGRFADGVRSGATLHYRQHNRNWSLVRDKRRAHEFGTIKGQVRRAAARVCICCAYSGRLPGLLPDWLDALAASADGLDCRTPELFVLDDSPGGFWRDAAPGMHVLSQAFSSVRVARVHDGVSAQQRRLDRTATARFLSVLYNRFLNETEAEVLWFVEDDILVPPDAGARLYRFLLDGERPRAAVSGFYKSRHEDCFVVSHTDGHTVTHAREIPSAPAAYDLAGTGCLMVFRPAARARFAPSWRVPGNGMVVHAHDWVYTWQLKEYGQPVEAHPEVVCRHYLSETEWV